MYSDGENQSERRSRRIKCAQLSAACRAHKTTTRTRRKESFSVDQVSPCPIREARGNNDHEQEQENRDKSKVSP